MTILVSEIVNGKLVVSTKDVPRKKPKCFSQEFINYLRDLGVERTYLIPLKGRDDRDDL